MGTWGTGNFDRDSALELLHNVEQPIFDDIEAFMDSDRVEADDVDDIVAGVAIITALMEHCGGHVPEIETVARWREKCLTVYDEFIDELDPGEEYKSDRRQVIVDTLAKLEIVVRKMADWK